MCTLFRTEYWSLAQEAVAEVLELLPAIKGHRTAKSALITSMPVKDILVQEKPYAWTRSLNVEVTLYSLVAVSYCTEIWPFPFFPKRSLRYFHNPLDET